MDREPLVLRDLEVVADIYLRSLLAEWNVKPFEDLELNLKNLKVKLRTERLDVGASIPASLHGLIKGLNVDAASIRDTTRGDVHVDVALSEP
jgi:hypothetical protein